MIFFLSFLILFSIWFAMHIDDYIKMGNMTNKASVYVAVVLLSCVGMLELM